MNWFYQRIANGVAKVIDSSIEAKVNHIIKHRFAILTKEEKIAFCYSSASESKAFFNFIDQVKVKNISVKFTYKSMIDTYEYSKIELGGKDIFKDLKYVCDNFTKDSSPQLEKIRYCVDFELLVRGEWHGEGAQKSFNIVNNGKYTLTNMQSYVKKFGFQLEEICPERLV